MVRRILVPTNKVVSVELPEEMVGKTIELLAFEIKEENATTPLSKEERLAKIQALTADGLVDLSNFRFNRDEANNYDE